MQVIVKRLPKSRVELTITVPADKMTEFFESAFQDLGSQVQLAGFRKGKAPRALVLEQIGEDRLAAHAIDLALPKTYHAAVVQEEIVPIAEPQVHAGTAEQGKDFVYTVEVDILPEVETGNYRNVKVDKKKHAAKPADPKEVEEQLTRICKAGAVPKEVLRAAKDGDLIEMNYTGKVGGVVQEGLQSHNHPLILGEKTILPEFEVQLVGMNAGEEKIFTLDVPKSDTEKQAVEFTAKLTKVSELVIPELDDELAKKFGKQSAAEVREAVEKQLTDEAQREARLGLESVVLDEVLKHVKTELPEVLIDREVAHRVEMLREQLSQAGQTLEQFLARQKKNLTDFRADIRPAAEKAVKTGLTLRAIAENEGFVDTSGDASEEVLKKTIDFLVENATG